MNKENKFGCPSYFKGQVEAYIYHIFNDTNKLKILLVFINKGFTWHRELKSLGLYNNVIEETLNEFNNLGFIELKDLLKLDQTQYETLKGVNQDLQHYYKIYFTNKRIYDILKQYEDDLEYIIKRNPQLNEFINDVKEKLKPFLIKANQISKEEKTQLTRKVNINGFEFEKDTLLKKEILKLTSTHKSKYLILQQIKPVSLMSAAELKRNTNKIIINNKEVNRNYLNEQEEKDKFAEKDFKNGNIGLTKYEVDINIEKRQKNLFNKLGIENEE